MGRRPIRQTAAQCAAIAAAVVMLSGCALGGRSLGRYVDDKSVTGRVKMGLASVHLSHLRRVNVDVYGGTVYLTGNVNSELEKSDAEIAAWQTKGVEQVVNDLVVRGGEREREAVSALPDFRPRHPLLERFSWLMERFSWVARVEPRKPGGPDLAYDREGHIVATVYTVSSRALVNTGAATLPADGRPVDRVSIYPVPMRDDVPEPLYAVVLWHVPERAAAVR